MTRNSYCCDCEVVHQEVIESVKNNMLSKENFQTIVGFFKAIGDATRIQIVWALYKHEMCVCDLANLLSMTKSAISHQLRELRINNIVKFRKSGKTVYYSLKDNHISNFIINAFEHVKE